MTMADQPKRVGQEKADPTIKSTGVVAEYPEGTHPIRPLKEQTLSAVNKEYKEMPDDEKPDPSTVANLEVRPDEK
jgi:hypothetical protein